MADVAASGTKTPDRKLSADSSTGSSFENVDAVETSSTASQSTEKESEKPNEFETFDVRNFGRTREDETAGEGKEAEEEDPLEAPMKPEQKQFYTSSDSYRAIRNLIMFSSAMFVLPLLTMFTLYHHVFIDYFHLPPDQAMLYAGLCGVAVVFVIVGLFVYVAYKEEKEAEQRLKESKKDE